MSRVYVAGASKEIDRAERCIAALREMGHEITLDWTVSMRANAGKKDRDLTREERLNFAIDDVIGVTSAQYLWLLVPSTDSCGCWIELGYALGSAVSRSALPVIVSGDFMCTIFTELTHRTYERDEDALAWFREAER